MLALAMGRPVAELQARMSSQEFTEWIAFYGVDPFGDARADARSGMLASVVANANRDPKKRSKPFRPDEFMLFLNVWETLQERLASEAASGPMGERDKRMLWSRIKEWALLTGAPENRQRQPEENGLAAIDDTEGGSDRSGAGPDWQG